MTARPDTPRSRTTPEEVANRPRSSGDARGPDVRFPPPALFVAVFFAGLLVQRAWPLVPLFVGTLWTEIIGVATMAGGFALVLAGILTFRRSRTAVYPNRPARRIVTHGVYRFTRNPMYLGMSALYLGGVVTTTQAWPLVLFPLVVIVLVVTVIRKEERHLHAAFPEEYAVYVRRVRRWV